MSVEQAYKETFPVVPYDRCIKFGTDRVFKAINKNTVHIDKTTQASALIEEVALYATMLSTDTPVKKSIVYEVGQALRRNAKHYLFQESSFAREDDALDDVIIELPKATKALVAIPANDTDKATLGNAYKALKKTQDKFLSREISSHKKMKEAITHRSNSSAIHVILERDELYAYYHDTCKSILKDLPLSASQATSPLAEKISIYMEIVDNNYHVPTEPDQILRRGTNASPKNG